MRTELHEYRRKCRSGPAAVHRRSEPCCPSREVAAAARPAQKLDVPAAEGDGRGRPARQRRAAAPGYSVGNLIFETRAGIAPTRRSACRPTRRWRRSSRPPAIPAMSPCSTAPRSSACACGHGSKPLRVVTSPGDRLPAFCSLDRPRPAGAARRRGGARAIIRALAAAVAQRAADASTSCSTRSPPCARRAGRRRPTRCLPGVESLAVCVRRPPRAGSSVAICISYSAAMISANEKSRIVTLLMRAGCELGMKFDDEYWAGAALRRLLGAVLERSRVMESRDPMSLELLMLGNVPVAANGRAGQARRGQRLRRAVGRRRALLSRGLFDPGDPRPAHHAREARHLRHRSLRAPSGADGHGHRDARRDLQPARHPGLRRRHLGLRRARHRAQKPARRHARGDRADPPAAEPARRSTSRATSSASPAASSASSRCVPIFPSMSRATARSASA